MLRSEINLHGGPEKFFEKYPVGGLYYGEGIPLLNDQGLEIGTQSTPEKMHECRKYSKHKLLVCADGVRMAGQKYGMGASLTASPDHE